MIINSLWKIALNCPVPLFKTDENDSNLAIFNEKGFYFSKEAELAYKTIKNLPHIYAIRLRSGDEFYFGKSNQKGGRFKRAHAYHLGGLAHELLGTTRYDDQRSHQRWIAAWFDKSTMMTIGTNNVVRMWEPVVVSFMKCEAGELLKIESGLIYEALRRGKKVLNVLK